MRLCCVTNLLAGSALTIVFAFGGCNAGTSPPGDPSAATVTVPDESEPPARAATGDGTPAASDPTPPETAAAADSAGPATPDTPARGSAHKGHETRTMEAIRRRITEHRKPVRECYDQARKQHKDLRGALTIHFVLDPEGKVKSAELNVERSDIKTPAVVDCAIAVIKSIQFPPSSRGMETSINYPYDFKP